MFPVQCSRHHNPQLIETKKKKKKNYRNFEVYGISLRKGREREGGFARFPQKKARLNVKPKKPSLQGVLAYGQEI